MNYLDDIHDIYTYVCKHGFENPVYVLVYGLNLGWDRDVPEMMCSYVGVSHGPPFEGHGLRVWCSRRGRRVG